MSCNIIIKNEFHAIFFIKNKNKFIDIILIYLKYKYLIIDVIWLFDFMFLI